MFDGVTQKEYGGKNWSARFKLTLANRSESTRKSIVHQWRSQENTMRRKKAAVSGYFRLRESQKNLNTVRRKNRSYTYFEARSFACHSGSNLYLGLVESLSWIPAPKPVDRDHLEWLEFFTKKKHMEPDRGMGGNGQSLKKWAKIGKSWQRASFLSN